MTQATRRSIAVIGGGVAGLTAAWILRHDARITLFEAQSRAGGHADTHDVTVRDGRTLAVDTGFIVHNRRTYPTLLRLFAELGVATQPSDMSMSVRCDGCGLEYAGARGPGGLFAQPRSALRLQYLRMLVEVVRFHRRARGLLQRSTEQTLEEFIEDGGFTPYFTAHFMTPLVAAVWSCAPADAGQYPARYLFEFLDNHGMLEVRGAPPWRTVVGGSRTYVDRITQQLDEVNCGEPARSVRRTDQGVDVGVGHSDWRHFDAVVVATHADQALRLLQDPSSAECDVLGAFHYSKNDVVLHSDPMELPTARRAQASWNYRMPSCSVNAEQVSVTYDLNRLQHLPAAERQLVTLNGDSRARLGRVRARMLYTHPVYTPASVTAQRRLHELNSDRLAFAGAYHGWGFHEDGARSGAAAARALGVAW